MSFDLIRRVETLGRPRILVVGDLTLDRSIWGEADRISREAPVPLLRADHREHRLGGAGGVATLLSALGADVRLIAALGRDSEAVLVRKLLSDLGIDDSLVVPLDDRPTTLKERYVGRAQDRHPRPMMQVDYEDREPIPPEVESRIWEQIPEAVAQAEIVLIADDHRGVCTASLLRSLVTACRSLDVRVVADPVRSADLTKYQGVHCLIPNRLEASEATGEPIAGPTEALTAGRELLHSLKAECVLVTLGRDGMALVHSDGREVVLPTRPREVYDITGAGDVVLAAVGLALASGADYEEAAALANVAAGLQVEKFGAAVVTRAELIADLLDHGGRARGKRLDGESLLEEVRRLRDAGKSVVFLGGEFERIRPADVRLLRESAALGDSLIVAVRSDAGLTDDDRAEVLEALEPVAAVTVYDDTPLALIEAILPDVLVHAGEGPPEDAVGRAEVEEAGGRVVTIPPTESRAIMPMVRRHGDRSLTFHAPHPAPPPLVPTIRLAAVTAEEPTAEEGGA